MATEFAMPAAATTFNSSPTQYTLYATQAQPISPVSSANTSPHDSSPTSPRSALSHLPAPTRQLRPMKSPLYVPAVLRPTEPPRKANRTSPVTPPQSMNSSFDNLHTAAPLTRRWTGDSAKSGLGQITEVDVSAEGLGKVTDLPTRQHWKVCWNPIVPVRMCHSTPGSRESVPMMGLSHQSTTPFVRFESSTLKGLVWLL